MIYSEAYIPTEDAGPFPGRIDPWAEDLHFFSQIHTGMIGDLVEQLRRPIRQLGYYVGTETSLQIARRAKPDVFVFAPPPREPLPPLNYGVAAAAVAAEPGIDSELEAPDLEAITIFGGEPAELVTVIEIISPSNKANAEDNAKYRWRRFQLVERGINIVEIDATRLTMHMHDSPRLPETAYHHAVYLPQAAARLILSQFHEPLKRLAVPLRAEVCAVEPHAAYEAAYRAKTIGRQIIEKHGYSETALPFPTLIPADHRAGLLAAVAAWRAKLELLRAESS